ncbi:hypothetical protein D3C87_1037990 [compost metagenome]
MKKIILGILVLGSLSSVALAKSPCLLTNGQLGQAFVVQYKAPLQGDLQQRKAVLRAELEFVFPKGSSLEWMDGSVAVMAQVAEICVSNKIGPLLTAQLLNRNNFVVVANPTVDSTQ